MRQKTMGTRERGQQGQRRAGVRVSIRLRQGLLAEGGRHLQNLRNFAFMRKVTGSLAL